MRAFLAAGEKRSATVVAGTMPKRRTTYLMSAIEKRSTSDQIIPKMSLRLLSTMSARRILSFVVLVSKEVRSERTFGANVGQVHSHLLDPLDRMLRVFHLLHAVMRCVVVATHRLLGEDLLFVEAADVSEGKGKQGLLNEREGKGSGRREKVSKVDKWMVERWSVGAEEIEEKERVEEPYEKLDQPCAIAEIDSQVGDRVVAVRFETSVEPAEGRTRISRVARCCEKHRHRREGRRTTCRRSGSERPRIPSLFLHRPDHRDSSSL